MLKAMRMGHMGAGCQAELHIIGICTVWAKGGKAMRIVGPRSHKATKEKGFRGNVQKDIKGVSRNNVGELRYNSWGRWGCIPSLRGGISAGRRRRKSRGRVRM
jgi:hypothetical protein